MRIRLTHGVVLPCTRRHQHHSQSSAGQKQRLTAPLADILALSSQASGKLDVCELCGGVGRTVRLPVRRMLLAGKIFDLWTGVELDSFAVQAMAMQYLEKRWTRAVAARDHRAA